MTAERHLDWDGCRNVRDLGGLTTTSGGTTRWRSVIRADSLDRLSPAGWRACDEYGVRTVVDLRSDIERDAEPYACRLTVVHAPIEDGTDRAFIDEWRPFSTPHYYAAALTQWPARTAAAVGAVAGAAPGGIVVHCGLGR